MSPLKSIQAISVVSSGESTPDKSMFSSNKKEHIPFLDLDPSPPPHKKKKHDFKSSLKSAIHRNPDQEEGEIVSSPELDAADIELSVNAMSSSSEDSEDEEEGLSTGRSVAMKEPTRIVTQETPEKRNKTTLTASINLITPDEPSSIPLSKDTSKEISKSPLVVPVPYKAVGGKHSKSAKDDSDDDDDDDEIDHLDIAAPLQLEAKRSSSKDDKNSPKKAGEHVKSISPRDDSRRKQSYDVLDERSRGLEAESEERRRKREYDRRKDERSRGLEAESEERRRK